MPADGLFGLPLWTAPSAGTIAGNLCGCIWRHTGSRQQDHDKCLKNSTGVTTQEIQVLIDFKSTEDIMTCLF